jgi:hypothetical protein
LRDDGQELRQPRGGSSYRASARTQSFASRQSQFKSLVATLDFSSFHKKVSISQTSLHYLKIWTIQRFGEEIANI